MADHGHIIVGGAEQPCRLPVDYTRRLAQRRLSASLDEKPLHAALEEWHRKEGDQVEAPLEGSWSKEEES